MSRAISDAWFHRIKSATRDLVKLNGGIERSGDIAGVSKSEVSRWQIVTDPSVKPLPAALALEADCGVALVTSVMADLNGRRLSDPDEEARALACVYTSHVEFVRAVADLMTTGAASFADGKITPAEAELMDRAVSDVERAMTQLKRGLSNVKANAGLQVVR